MATAFSVGQRWEVKRGHDAEADRYGAGAVVVGVWVGVDRPHPGFIHHTMVDLDTDSGINLRGWSPSRLRGSMKLKTA